MADAARPVRRFYKQVSRASETGGIGVRLDGRPVRTPARALLLLPTSALAEAVVAEWEAQAERIHPHAMPLTGLANAAIDRASPDPAAFAATLASYAETDLLCYRAGDPPPLVRRQAAAWDPLLAWARQRYDVAFELATGIIHQPQPAATVTRLAEALAARDAFALAAMSPLVTISGSLITALALAEGEIDAPAAFDTTHLDELWQAEQWGEDGLARQARDARRADFLAAARFLALLEKSEA